MPQAETWTYGAKLKELRERRGFTQAQLAAKVGVQLGSYGNWERGTQNPNPKRLRELVAALDCDPNEIGYEAPEGWELVPSEWVRQQFEQMREELKDISRALTKIERASR